MDAQPTSNELGADVAKENNIDTVNMSIAQIDKRLSIKENMLCQLQMDNQKKGISMKRSRKSLDTIESEIMDLHRKFADIKEKKARLHILSESDTIKAVDDYISQAEQIDQINTDNLPMERQLKIHSGKRQKVIKDVRGGKTSKQIGRVDSVDAPTQQATDSLDTNSNILDSIENVPEVRTRPQRLRKKPKCCIQCQHDVMNATIALFRQKRKALKTQKHR